MHQLMSEAKQFSRANRELLAWLSVGALISYGFAISNFSLSIDEEFHLVTDETLDWMAQGRWGTTLLKLLFGTTLPLPFVQPAIAVLVLVGSALVWCFIFLRVTGEKLTNSPWLMLFAVLYVTMPSNAYYLSFNTYNTEVSCGLLLAAMCVLFATMWAIEHGGWTTLIVAAIFAMLAIATYQVLAIVCAVGIVVANLLHLEALPPAWRPATVKPIQKSMYLCFPLLLGYALYWVVNFIVSPTNSYVNVFFNWGKLDTKFIFGWLAAYVVAFLRGDGFVGGKIALLLAVAGAFSLLIFIWRAARFGRVLQLVLFLLILVSPFLLSFGLGTAMPNRTQLVFPLAYGAIVLILALQLGIVRRGRILALTMTVLVLSWNAQANTRLFLSEYLSFKRDEAAAHLIAARLFESGWAGTSAPMVVVGSHSYQPERYLVKDETIGASFFAQDDGSRAPPFMNVLGYPLVWATQAQKKTAYAISESLPEWPRPGSVTFVDGIAIVKMGPPTEGQRRVKSP
jgi:hypothetical protein